MKRAVWIVLVLMGMVAPVSAQYDDLYFVPKKKKTEIKAEATVCEHSESEPQKTMGEAENFVSATGLEMNEDAYNRRWSYLTEDGSAVSELAKDDEGFVLITEEGDTMWTASDTLRLTRVANEEGWVNGFDGSDSDYEYAMRIIRFRNPRYAIPVSSPLYWDVVYGNSLWPSWEWNIYDDGLYAYVFPTSSNWYYWDYRMSYPFGWSPWGNPWVHHHGVHWGHHWGGHYGWHFYGHVWYDPWFNPYFHDYYPGWHVGHHHGHYPGFGVGKPGWNGPKAFPNHRTTAGTATRRDTQTGSTSARSTATSGSSRTGATASRSGSDATRRVDNGSNRNSSVRVVTGSTSRTSGTVRSSSSRSGSDELIRRTTGSSSVSRSTGSSSVNRTTATGSSSRSSYTRQSTSRSSNSNSSYNRPSSTRSSSSSSVSRSSSSGSSRSGSYSSGSSSSSRSSYSSGSSHSSYSSGGSSSGGSSRSSGGAYSGGSNSRSSGSRR